MSRRELLSTNSGSRLLRENPRLLIYGKCVADEHPEIVREFSEGRVALAACPEADHINKISLKVLSMITRVPLRELVVLTIDGSPHCVQLHHAIEEASRASGSDVDHFVIEKGKATKVSDRAIKAARYLSRVDDLLGH